MDYHRLLITGGAGFIGHHLIEHIMRGFTEMDPAETRICVLDRLDETASFERLSDITTWKDWRERVSTVWHDLKAPINATVVHTINEGLGGRPTAILHLAAASHVDRSIVNPTSFVQDNVVGTVNLLDYVTFLSETADCNGRLKPTVLIFSTDEVYGPAQKGEVFVEGDRHNPGNPYAATKSAAESMARAYRNTYGLDLLITNCMNVFGERQSPEKFIPMTIRKCINGESNIVHTDPDGVPGSRFYLHARNCADATVFVLLNGTKDHGDDACAGTYHIVGYEEVSNLAVVKKVHALVSVMKKLHGIKVPKLDTALVDFHSVRPGHDLRYAQSGDRLANMGFGYKKSFDRALNSTVLWYLENPTWLEV